MSDNLDIHPNAPTGGGGPGVFKSASPSGTNPQLDKWSGPASLGSNAPAPGSSLPGPASTPGLVNAPAPAAAPGSAGAGGSGSAPAPASAPGAASAAAAAQGAPAAGAATNAASDAEIEALNLADVAKKAAYELKKKHPSVKFTSGRRNKSEQASAMAGNVVLNRNWIKETYAQSQARDACQKWVDDNEKKKSAAEITQGLTVVLNGLTDAQLANLSKHLSGEAFDVQPVTEDADKIKETIGQLSGLSKFLEKEGGLVRWHAQF